MAAATQTNGRFVARVASYGPLLPPAEFAARARKLRTQGELEMKFGNSKRAEKLFRDAIEHFVDAFLTDRRGQQRCFVEAHVLGAFVLQKFSCPMRTTDGEAWESRCGMSALHNRLGASPAGITEGECSICSAADFECSHVPGVEYDGEACHRLIRYADLKEVSLVRFPADPRCYRVELPVLTESMEPADQARARGGEAPSCTHCMTCDSTEPTEMDINQSLWEDLPTLPLAGAAA